MITEHRFSPLEIRGEGDGLHGVVMRYGTVAELGGFKERFEPGAFGDVAAADVVCNVQHDRGRPFARTGPGGGLALADSPSELRATLRGYPDTREAADAIALVAGGVLRGFSIEFQVPDGGDRFEGTLRTVSRAELVGLAVVDKPAFAASVAKVAERAAVQGVREERGAVMLAAMIESALARAPNRDALLAALASTLDVPIGNLKAAAEPDVGGLRGEDLPAWLLS